MRFDEVTRILKTIDSESFSTYEANEYFPKLTARQMASILRRDERIARIGKRWLWLGCGHWARIMMWGVVA